MMVGREFRNLHVAIGWGSRVMEDKKADRGQATGPRQKPEVSEK